MTARRLRVLVLLAIVLPACAVNPVTGRRELSFLSEGDEIRLGRETDEQIVQELGLYDDPELAAWIDRTGQRLAAASERPQLPWTFRVVDDDTVNAFALPGGFIYMTRGILGYMNSEAQVVGVLGHEIGHVTARHSARQMTNATLAQIGLGVGSILSPEVRAVSDLLQTGLGLLFLKFSRDDESQADELGVRYAATAGYDPRELSGFFETIDRLTSGGGRERLPTWLSTHPAPQNRVGRVMELSEPYVDGAVTLRVGRDPHLSRIDGIVFGPDPREGFVDGGTFKHPDLLFQLEFPDAWEVQNGRSAVTVYEPEGDAVIVLTLANPDGGIGLRAHAEAVVEQRGGSGAIGEAIDVSGLRGYRVQYRTALEGVGQVDIVDTFIEYGDLVYEIAGLAPPVQFRRYRDVMARSATSFRRLDRSEADRIQPHRIELLRLPRAAAIAQVLEGRRMPIDIEVAAVLNGVTTDQLLPASTLVKAVRPGF